MRRLAALLLLALPCRSILSQQPSVPIATLKSSTKLVIVDVLAEDKAGHPVRNLKASDLRLTESHTLQTIRSLEEVDASAPQPVRPHLPALPAGAFVDYEPVSSAGALNVILLDALNTPQGDQARLRRQLALYVSHLRPNSRIAIFGLATRLYLLQGFTTDPALLGEALRKDALPRKSPLLNRAAGPDSDPNPLIELLNSNPNSPGAGNTTVQILQQFDVEAQASKTRLRVQYTLDAFAVLTRYLAQFSGRKNLIWFSGSFPSDVVPNPALKSPYGVTDIDARQFRQVINLLTRAQVAVYPIDAQGLSINPGFSSADSPATISTPSFSSTAATGVLNDPTLTDSPSTSFENEEITRHGTMQTIANATGGRAFYNNNDLDSAIASAITAGSDFYTLSYRSTDLKTDGAFRPIHIELAPGAGVANVHLHYRQGYFADQPVRLDPILGEQDPDSASSPYSLSLQRAADRYTEAIMARGGPTPSEILFEARVLPTGAPLAPDLTPGNRPNPKRKLAGPFRTYSVEVVALTPQFTLVNAGADRAGAVEMLAYLYDTEGNLLLLDGRTVRIKLTPQQEPGFLATPLHLQLTLSAPANIPTVLRLALRDVPSNRSGVLELPSVTLDHPAALPISRTAVPASPHP